MSKYKITESVGNRVQAVNSYEDLEIHHPSANATGLRTGRTEDFQNPARRRHERVDGEFEEVRHTRDGGLLVEKDFILSRDGNGPVNVPAPIAGYIHYTRDATATVQIFEQPGGQGKLLAQVLHMDSNSFTLREGAKIEYGQPIGAQGETGSPGSIHCHVEVNVGQFKKYISDMANGTITPGSYPAIGSVQATPAIASVIAAPLVDGVLRQGERGAEVTALQQQLINLKFKDAQGNALTPDGDFGNRTKEAVASFQRAHHLTDDGVVGKDTFAALRQTVPSVQAPVPAAVAPIVPVAAGTTALSNLIGSGEGGYNSYNRGVAGDSRTPINLSDMTISEIMRRQDLPRNDPDRLFAIGKFQIIPGTMEETVRNLGLNGSEKFTPALQERMFSDYLVDEKRPAVKAYITGNSSGPDGLGRAQLALAQEFASVANPQTGRSYYDGDSGGNHSSISARQVETSLNQMRTQYQANIHSGLTPDAAYRALNGQGQAQAPAASTQIHAPTTMNALADGVLHQGERGPDVKKLQGQLNALGFKDAQGKALVADSDFGDKTKQAVEAFQRARGLVDDGVVGKDTFAALKKSELAAVVAPTSPPVVAARTDQSPLLSDPNHPDHALYKQALVGLEKLPASTFKNEQERQNAAASVAFEAKVTGLTKIDNVALSTNGSGLFAVQGAMNDPAHQRIYVDKAQAAAQPIEKSTQQMQQDTLLAQPAQQEQQKRPGILIA